MAERTLEATEEALFLPAIVTAAADVTAWAETLGLLVIPEDGPGLDRAAAAGVAWAQERGLRWMILHADLPLIAPEELAAIRIVVEAGGDLIAPSSDGGTTVIAGRSRFAFAYGPGSFHRHLARLSDPVVTTSTGTLHDLDSPDDLIGAAAHPRGSWLAAVVAGSGIQPGSRNKI